MKNMKCKVSAFLTMICIHKEYSHENCSEVSFFFLYWDVVWVFSCLNIMWHCCKHKELIISGLEVFLAIHYDYVNILGYWYLTSIERDLTCSRWVEWGRRKSGDFFTSQSQSFVALTSWTMYPIASSPSLSLYSPHPLQNKCRTIGRDERKQHI